MLNSSKIAELQGRIATLEASLSTAEGQLAQAQTDLTAAHAEAAKVPVLSAENADLKASLAAANAKAEKAETDLTTAKAEFETNINAEVTNRLASAGVDPIKRDPKAKQDGSVITRAEFNAMTPEQQNAHFAAGGKMTD